MPLIDTFALNQFYQNDDALLVDMVGIFAKHLPTIATRLRNAIANRDANELHEASHQFKSDLGYFFATDLRSIACQLEAMGRNQKLDGCEELAEQLFHGLEGLLAELSERTHLQFDLHVLGALVHRKEFVR
jgi:HPt (histidine-containing phosphotransfer) domain-containing protein